MAAGGFITLLKTLPDHRLARFKDSLASLREGAGGGGAAKRTERDLPITVVLFGSLGLVVVMALLPFVPGTSVAGKLLLGAARSSCSASSSSRWPPHRRHHRLSSNPISGMTIATLMATCLIFVGIGWTGDVYQPMALCVGGMVCIAAANAGATSQDLKTGYLVGATPRAQQIGLMIGAVAAAVVIGLTVQVLDTPTEAMRRQGIVHTIGTEKFPAPQGTLMATLIKGLLAHNLDWQFVLVGVFLAITMELCGVSRSSFAVGAYLPLSTTPPIFVGGAIKGLADRIAQGQGRAGRGGRARRRQPLRHGPGRRRRARRRLVALL